MKRQLTKSIFLFVLTSIALVACSETTTLHTNARVHSLGLKKSVVTKPEGSLGMYIERSRVSHDDTIIKIKDYHNDGTGEFSLSYKTAKLDYTSFQKYKIGFEYALTDDTTLDGGFIVGSVNHTSSEDAMVYGDASFDSGIVRSTQFWGTSCGVKHKILDNDDNIHLSGYASYEGLNFEANGNAGEFNSTSHEVFLGLITGWYEQEVGVAIPSASVFYTGYWSSREQGFGTVPKNLNVNSIGCEANLLFDMNHANLLFGVGLQKSMDDFDASVEGYGFFRFGVDFIRTERKSNVEE